MVQLLAARPNCSVNGTKYQSNPDGYIFYKFTDLTPSLLLLCRPTRRRAPLKIKSDPQGAGVRRGSDHPLTPKSVLTFLGGSDPPQERSDFSRGGVRPPQERSDFSGAWGGWGRGFKCTPPPGSDLRLIKSSLERKPQCAQDRALCGHIVVGQQRRGTAMSSECGSEIAFSSPHCSTSGALVTRAALGRCRT